MDEKRMTLRQCLDGMMDSDMVLYEKILDTPGFAYYFNQLCLLAEGKELESQLKPCDDVGVKEIEERLAIEYHSGSTGIPQNIPIIDFRQALQDIELLLSLLKKCQVEKKELEAQVNYERNRNEGNVLNADMKIKELETIILTLSEKLTK